MTTYKNAGPESIEEVITKPVEDALMSLSNLKKLSSISSEGTSSVIVEFTQGTNTVNIANGLYEKIDEINSTLPAGGKIEIIEYNSVEIRLTLKALLQFAWQKISAIGIVMLVGMVVNNGIILVDYTIILVQDGMELNEACLKAGVSRLRPVLMTTLTTILGTIPMALDSSGNSAIIQPIGLGIVGGLTSSTFVTLIFIPVVYSIVMEKSR